MATASRTTTTYPTNATGISNFRATYTTPLRAAFVQGNIIRAADINLLRTAITTFNNHTHSVIDYRSIGTFGNNGPRTVVAANPRVSDAMSGSLTPTEVAPSGGGLGFGGGGAPTTILATTINTYVAACNATRNHVHNIFDTVS